MCEIGSRQHTSFGRKKQHARSHAAKAQARAHLPNWHRLHKPMSMYGGVVCKAVCAHTRPPLRSLHTSILLLLLRLLLFLVVVHNTLLDRRLLASPLSGVQKIKMRASLSMPPPAFRPVASACRKGITQPPPPPGLNFSAALHAGERRWIATKRAAPAKLSAHRQGNNSAGEEIYLCSCSRDQTLGERHLPEGLSLGLGLPVFVRQEKKRRG